MNLLKNNIYKVNQKFKLQLIKNQIELEKKLKNLERNKEMIKL